MNPVKFCVKSNKALPIRIELSLVGSALLF